MTAPDATHDLTPSGESAVRLALEVGRLRRERDEARATVARVEALADEWRSLPVWGPDEHGLMILDDVDHEGLMAELRAALRQP